MSNINIISLVLIVEFNNEESSKIAYNAIYPEIKFSSSDRVNINANLIKNCLKITVKAKDFIILRAVFNTYMRWLNNISKILQIISE